MYEGSTVGVVVPCYNEESFITDVLETMPEFVDRVFVVDDHSTDETWPLLQEYLDETALEHEQAVSASTIPNVNEDTAKRSITDGGSALQQPVVAVRHQKNKGRGAAITTGYRLAMIDEIDVVAVMDGDGQMDPSILDQIIDPVVRGDADYAKGDRLKSLRNSREMSRWRLFGNWLLTILTRVATGYWGMRDPQNGYTAISKETLKLLDLESLYEDYGFLNDLLIHLSARGLQITDVPMDAKYGDETSGIRYRSFAPKLSLLLLRGFLWRLFLAPGSKSGVDEDSVRYS